MMEINWNVLAGILVLIVIAGFIQNTFFNGDDE